MPNNLWTRNYFRAREYGEVVKEVGQEVRYSKLLNNMSSTYSNYDPFTLVRYSCSWCMVCIRWCLKRARRFFIWWASSQCDVSVLSINSLKWRFITYYPISWRGCDALFEEAKNIVLKYYPEWNPELMPMQLPQWNEINPNNQRVLVKSTSFHRVI